MKLSIILNTYNSERFINECLEVLKKQLCEDVEVIVIDDASIDNTFNIVTSAFVDVLNIKIIKNEKNFGISYSRNLGLAQAIGDYVMFLDGDDYLIGNSIKTILKDIENNYDLIKYQILTNRAGEESGLYFNSLKQGFHTGEDLKSVIDRMLYIGNTVLFSVNSYVYKKELIKDIRFYESSLYSGNSFVLECLLKTKNIYLSNTYFYYYRLHLNSLFCNNYTPKIKEYPGFVLECFNLVKEYDDSYLNNLSIFLFFRLMIGKIGIESVIFNEFCSNPYPDIAYENVKEMFNDKAIIELLNTASKICTKDAEKELVKCCLDKDVDWFKNKCNEYFLGREEHFHKLYGYVHPNEFCINYDKHIIYLVNPKVACSSIKAAISDYDYEDDYEVHKFQRLRTDMYVHNTLDDLDKRDFFIFTFVREPFHRLVSAYESKQKSDLRIGFNQYLSYRGGILSRDKGFDFYLKTACETPDEYADRHFRSQYSLIYDKDGNQMPDFVGHLENIKEEYPPIKEKYKLKELPRLNKTDSRDKKDWKEYYTLETAEMVHERYKKDFEVFGYEDTYKELIEYLKTKN